MIWRGECGSGVGCCSEHPITIIFGCTVYSIATTFLCAAMERHRSWCADMVKPLRKGFSKGLGAASLRSSEALTDVNVAAQRASTQCAVAICKAAH